MNIKDKLLSGLSYGLIAYPLFAATWQFLPELQSLLPQYTSQIAYLTALPSGILGAVGFKIQAYVKKARESDYMVFKGLADKYDILENSVTAYKNDMKATEKQYVSLINANINEIKDLKSVNQSLVKLLKVDLEAKLSNPLIDSKVKALIEGVKDEV
jgi:hypothetical protein